jgi:hypothetical protein
MQTKTTHMAVRHTSPISPGWVAGVLLLSWLGFWFHEFFRVPVQFGFTLESTLFHLLPALIVFLTWWRFPRSILPLSGMWALGILHGLVGGVLSVLPLPIWPFAPPQTVSHYAIHGVYVIAQIPLLLLAFTLMRRLRVAPSSLHSAK